MGRAKFHKARRREARQRQGLSDDQVIARQIAARATQIQQDRRFLEELDPAAGLQLVSMAAEAAAAAEILAEGRTEATVWELAENALGYAQWSIDDMLSRTPADQQPACRAGCAFCCAIPVEVHPAEALAITLRLHAAMTADELTAVIARLRARVDERRGWSTDQRWAQKRFCVFLREDWHCGIYPIRPLTCRGYSSLSREACEQAYADQAETVRIHSLVRAIASGVGHGLHQAAEAFALETGRYELESAILRALEMPDAAARWVRGERIFAGCDQIPMPAHVVRQIVAMNR